MTNNSISWPQKVLPTKPNRGHSFLAKPNPAVLFAGKTLPPPPPLGGDKSVRSFTNFDNLRRESSATISIPFRLGRKN